jgi:hypothetical protein
MTMHLAHRKPRSPRGSCGPGRDLRPQFRLRPGRDDRLIEWLSALAPRERSQAIREALRAHLASRGLAAGDPVTAAGRAADENLELAAALDALF